MHSRIPAVIAALTVAVSLSAQEPLPPETMNKASYAMGLNVGRQVQAATNGMNKEMFLKGFADGAQQEMADAMSYAEGHQMAIRMRRDPIGFNPSEVLKGIQDGGRGAQPAYPDAEMQAAMEQLQAFAMAKQQEAQRQQEARQAEIRELSEANRKVGEEFLKQNAAKEGVVTTLSGLQYQVLKEGEGAKPSATSSVRVHYVGRLLNGNTFDSSVERGEPVEFPLNGVIPGWTEGLQLMSPGAKYRFWIPAQMAYGENAPPAIGPNQVLDFEVELLDITKP